LLFIKMKLNLLFSELESRLARVREGLSRDGLTHILVSNKSNLFYLTGLGSGVAVVGLDEAVLWLKDLYIKQHSSLYEDDKYPLIVRPYDRKAVFDYLKQINRGLGVEDISVSSYNRVVENLGYKPPTTEVIESERMIKSDYEIGLLEKSASIAVKGMDKAREVAVHGCSEAEAAAEVEAELRRLGSECPPFKQGILLASGSATADIHANPQLKKIKNNSLVLVDLGARYGNYYSDMTRTFTVGSVGGEIRQMMEFVSNLELETIDLLHVGLSVGEIHEHVEEKIQHKGLRFYHSTGHGVGLDVHEKPSISADSDLVVREGMVFTIEPGIYLANKYGVRFEDMVHVRKNKIRVLTK